MTTETLTRTESPQWPVADRQRLRVDWIERCVVTEAMVGEALRHAASYGRSPDRVRRNIAIEPAGGAYPNSVELLRQAGAA